MVGAGSSKSKSESKNKTATQEKYINKAVDLYGQELGKNQNVFQGQRVADFSDLQNQTFDFASRGGFIQSPEQVEDYYQNVIKAPAMRQFSEDVLPGIKEDYAGPGYFSSGRAGKQADARSDLASDLNTARSQLFYDTQQDNKQAAMDVFNLGSAQQQQEQAEINAAIQKYAEENAITDPENLSILMNLLGLNAATSKGMSRSWNFSVNPTQSSGGGS